MIHFSFLFFIHQKQLKLRNMDNSDIIFKDPYMRSYLRRVVLLSLVAMLFASISNANLGIIGQFASQNGNHWVGLLSIAFEFLGSGIAGLYNGYIGRWKYKAIIFCGAMGWNIFLTFSVIFLFIGFSDLVVVVIVAGSLLCGFLLSTYYNGTNNYINECGKRDNRTNSYFGLNMCIIQCANLLGNGLSAILIKPLGQKTYSFVMLALNVLISLLYLLTKQFPVEQKAVISQQQEGSLMQSISQEGTNTGRDRKIPKMLFFVFAFSGIMISFVFGELSIAFYQYYGDMEDEELNKLTFMTFMIEGCGEFVGGLAVTLFAHKIKRVVLFNFLNSILFIACVCLIWQGFQLHSQLIIQISVFFIGFADCVAFSLALAIGGKWDQDGLSLCNFGQSVTVGMITSLYIFVGIPNVIFVYLTYLLLATLAAFRYRKQIDDQKEEVYKGH